MTEILLSREFSVEFAELRKKSEKGEGDAERLMKHHAVILAAMKAKQNVELKYVKDLKKSIEALLLYYPGPKD